MSALIFAPRTDIAAEDEADKIIKYLENGGKAIILSDYTDHRNDKFQLCIGKLRCSA